MAGQIAGDASPADAAPASIRRHASIGALAHRHGLVFGTSIAQDSLDDPALGALTAWHARILTTDYAMKMGALRIGPAVSDFHPLAADRIVAFAREHQIPLRGHTLIWNEDRPDWLMRLSTAERRAAFDRHIDQVAGYYAGQLQSWDVVNEAFWPGHGLAGDYRDGPWWEAFGKDYVVRAFKRAQAADPGTRLVLNEAHTEQWTQTGARIRAGLLRLVDELLDAGVRLDAVGLQGHLQSSEPHNDAAFVEFLAELAARKVDLYITELDVNDSAYPDALARRDAAVALRYEEFLSAVLAVPAVRMVVTWQLSDKASWLRHHALATKPGAKRLPRPLPFDDRLAPKAAYKAIMAAIGKRRPSAT